MLSSLYPHGLSSGDFAPTLGPFLDSAKVLSAALITNLTDQWTAEQLSFTGRDLSELDFVHL